MAIKLLKYISTTLTLLFLILFNSCTSEENNTTTIKFWAMGSEAEYVTKLVPEFEKRNPGIKVKVQANSLDMQRRKNL